MDKEILIMQDWFCGVGRAKEEDAGCFMFHSLVEHHDLLSKAKSSVPLLSLFCGSYGCIMCFRWRNLVLSCCSILLFS
jgi:hypothetical protein